MGFAGFGDDAGDAEVDIAVGVFDADDLIEGGGVVEEFFRYWFRYYYRIGFLEGGGGVAFDEMVRKYLEEVGIGEVAFAFVERRDELSAVEILDKAFVVVEGDEHTGRFVDFGEFEFKRGGEWRRGNDVRGFFALVDGDGGDAVDVFGVGIVAVVGELVEDVDENEHAAGEADGQAGDVDEGEEFVSPGVTQGGFKVVAEHSA
jgi:hypothetical protein